MRRWSPFEKFVIGLCIFTLVYFTGHILTALFDLS